MTTTYAVRWNNTGEEEALYALSIEEARNAARDLAHLGERGNDGAIVSATVISRDAAGTQIGWYDLVLAIPPDHAQLIRDALDRVPYFAPDTWEDER